MELLASRGSMVGVVVAAVVVFVVVAVIEYADNPGKLCITNAV